jgi:RsiW-degrading membrane proteinase PrsW (M82 family)
VIIVILSAFWIFSSLFASESSLPYYLPMFWWSGLLLYFYNQGNFKNIVIQVLAFLILLGAYFWGIALIKATFAF